MWTKKFVSIGMNKWRWLALINFINPIRKNTNWEQDESGSLEIRKIRCLGEVNTSCWLGISVVNLLSWSSNKSISCLNSGYEERPNNWHENPQTVFELKTSCICKSYHEHRNCEMLILKGSKEYKLKSGTNSYPWTYQSRDRCQGGLSIPSWPSIPAESSISRSHKWSHS